MARLEFHLLGVPKITLDGSPVQTDRRKALALLFYLACSNQPQRREHLADLFWPDYSREQAYAYLRRTLWEVNQMLGRGWLQADRDEVDLLRRPEIYIDSIEFKTIAARISHDLAGLERQVALYRGDFLSGFNLRDSPDFERWQTEQTEALRRSYIVALGKLSKEYALNDQVEKAVTTIRLWLAQDPLDEEAYRQLMRVYASSGQRSLALKVFQNCTKFLEEELGAAPDPSTASLYEQIRTGKIAARSTSVSLPPEVKTGLSKNVLSHLPSQPTRFVGRSMELLEIHRLLSDPSCRLLTLLGPGGMGKTRLAVEAASQLVPFFAQGAHFIELSSLTSPDLIPSEIATVLELNFSEAGMGGKNAHLVQLLDYLRPRQLLLILDNFEHLLDGADLVSQILSAAPQVKILTTSRERLNLPGEWIFEIEGMSYPVDKDLRDLEAYSSVQLFLSVARRNQPGFQIEPENQGAVARICRGMQGMPLGIELAAAWIRILSPQDIANEIERNLDFLSASQRGVPERHRNLRTVFQHSWQLLTTEERLTFIKLAVFNGGFTRQAAEQIAGASLSMLNTLVDKSLVRRSSGNRFDLHEVLHRFAIEKLGEDPSLLITVEQSHSSTFLSLLTEMQAWMSGQKVKDAHAVLDLEFDNIRQAWLFAIKNSPVDQLVKPLLSLISYVETRGRQIECASLLQSAIPLLRERLQLLPGDENLLQVLAISLIMLGNYEHFEDRALFSQPFFKEAWAILQKLPDSLGKAYALILCSFGALPFSGLEIPREIVQQNYHAVIRTLKQLNDRWGLALAYISHTDSFQDNPDSYQAFFEETLEGLQIFKDLGSIWGEALCYKALANFVNWHSNIQTAIEYGQKAAAIYRDLGDSYRLVSIQLHLGQIETAIGNYERAKSYYDENLKIVSQLGRRFYITAHQDSIGYLELLLGNLDQAEKYFTSSLEIYHELEHEHGIGMALSNLGDVAYRRGELARAEDLLRQALTLQMAIRDPWGTTICLKKLGLVTFELKDYETTGQLWSQALGLSLQYMFVTEALEIMVYFAMLDEIQGNRHRAFHTLRTIQGNPSLSHEAAKLLESQLHQLNESCSPDELELFKTEVIEKDARRWIEDGLGVKPLRLNQLVI